MRDPHRLIAYLDDWVRTPFAQRDLHDICVRFAAGAVQAQTGADPIRRLGHRWSTPLGAKRVLNRLGGLAAAVDRVLAPVPLALAHRGDIGLVEARTGPLLVVIEGETLVGPDPRGLRRLPRARLVKAWSAG